MNKKARKKLRREIAENETELNEKQNAKNYKSKLIKGEKYRAFRVEKFNNKPEIRTPLVYLDEKFYIYDEEKKEVVKLDKNVEYEGKTSFRIVVEGDPFSSHMSYSWDQHSHLMLKIFYISGSKKMLYFFLNDVKKMAEVEKLKVTYNKHAFEEYLEAYKKGKHREITDLALTIDLCMDEPYKDASFIDEIVNFYAETDLYDREKENRDPIARYVGVSGNSGSC